MRIGCDLWRRHFAGADRPYWLIGNCDLRELLGREIRDASDALRFENLIRLAALAVMKLFADAIDRGQAGLQRSEDFLLCRFVSFPEVLTPLAVRDDHPFRSYRLQHIRGDFACVCSF